MHARRFTAAATVAILGLAAVPPAAATILVPMADADLVATSDLIVTGYVERIESALLAGPRVVTRVTLAVERTLKGDPGAESVVITEPGGIVGDWQVVIGGAPEFVRGERALVFLRLRRDGTLGTNALALGKYTLAVTAAGLEARRAAPVVDARPGPAFEAHVAALAAGQRGARADGRAGAGVAPATRAVVTDAFTFATIRARWFEADCALPVSFSPTNADDGLEPGASVAAIADATAAWTDVATAALGLAVGPDDAPARSLLSGGTSDGRNLVVFNDPFGEVPDLAGCSGVLALGGFTASSSATFGFEKTIDGLTFGRILEGDVTVNPGVGACLGASGLAEVAAHEVGHAIGFGHSSENAMEPDPGRADALMYFRAHADGRGASVRADDVAGLEAAYPLAEQVTTPLGSVACDVGLGIFGVACFGQTLPSAPFTLARKAAKAAGKAAATTKLGQQRKQLKKAFKLLGKADAKVATGVPGTCGEAMRARLAALRARVNDLLATL